MEAGDNGTKELLEAILKDDQNPIDWIEAQHDQIKQMGIQIYLGEQIGRGGPCPAAPGVRIGLP